MPIDRQAAIAYAKKHWNRVCDDEIIAISSGTISVSAKRREMNAPASEGWEVFFLPDAKGGEFGEFRRTVGGKTEIKPDPVVTFDALDDCTHYVSRCLKSEGLEITETHRANEMIEGLKKSSGAKVLAEKINREQGQKIIESGIFKPGDVIGVYTMDKSRYTHTAMYIGDQTSQPDVVGGLTCHTICRYGGLTKAWNNADDDVWFLYEMPGQSYTLIHFSQDDSQLGIGWLYGWWKLGRSFYFVSLNGTAKSIQAAPSTKNDHLRHSDASAQLFQDSRGIVFVWRKQHAGIQVEKWSGGMPNQKTAIVQTQMGPAKATRLF
jgi:NlpC/P60 family